MCGFGQFLSTFFNRRSGNVQPKPIEEESELEDIEKVIKKDKGKDKGKNKDRDKDKVKSKDKAKEKAKDKAKDKEKDKSKKRKESVNYTEPNPNRRKPKISKNKKGESIIIQDIDNATLLETKKSAIPTYEDSIFDFNLKNEMRESRSSYKVDERPFYETNRMYRESRPSYELDRRNKIINLDEEILLKEDKKVEYTDYSYIIDKYISSRKDQNELPKKEISLLLKNRMSQYLKSAKKVEKEE